tara:strand:- start:1375 stop:1758 length:384 start_codon:yes stop_codon:yes gene_type:complete
MIYGIGIDIIDIKRIKRVINKYGNRFKQKCFHEHEIIKSETRLNSVESYAKRYAAKEACAKALGTGLARGVFWKDIEVRNNQYGKPYIILHNNARKTIKKSNNKINKIFLSLSDEKDFAIANVIIFK